MAASLLPAEAKPTGSSGEAFIAANARKLGALLVLFLIGCLGLGTKVWLGFEEATVDVTQVVSRHEVSCARELVQASLMQCLQSRADCLTDHCSL